MEKETLPDRRKATTNSPASIRKLEGSMGLIQYLLVFKFLPNICQNHHWDDNVQVLIKTPPPVGK